MRIKTNRRYYFKYIPDVSTDSSTPIVDRQVWFGYFYKHRNTQAYDQDEKGRTILLKYRAKCYSTKPKLRPSKIDPTKMLGYYDYIVMQNTKGLEIITSKEFNTLYSLFGPKNEK